MADLGGELVDGGGVAALAGATGPAVDDSLGGRVYYIVSVSHTPN